jgi:NAD(P)H-dependent flavin oxidoreductase YrpB (nitropropane dioxygenase family)
MQLMTRLTERLGIEYPILLAPMNVFAGGRLAAAVSEAGGLGLIGGGYGDADWLEAARSGDAVQLTRKTQRMNARASLARHLVHLQWRHRDRDASDWLQNGRRTGNDD